MADEQATAQPEPVTGCFDPETLAELNAIGEQIAVLERERSRAIRLFLAGAGHREQYSVSWDPRTGAYTATPKAAG